MAEEALRLAGAQSTKFFQLNGGWIRYGWHRLRSRTDQVFTHETKADENILRCYIMIKIVQTVKFWLHIDTIVQCFATKGLYTG